MNIPTVHSLSITEMDGGDGFAILFNKLIAGERVAIGNSTIDAEQAILSIALQYADTYQQILDDQG